MSRVVVVGGGFGGMAAAARLAKLGHEVTLIEATSRLGGALGFVERDGFRWDSGPAHTLLPAVIRDLFRKSGRAAEKEIDLVPTGPTGHWFPDGTRLELPHGSRAGQLEAIDTAIGPGTGRLWGEWTAAFADDWEALRKDWMERPWSPDVASKQARALLSTRLTLHKSAARQFRDERLWQLAVGTAAMDGHDPRNVPAWVGMTAYLEQNFGRWTVPGGLGHLADVLAQRLATRRVEVVLDTDVLDLATSQGRVSGVRTASGVVPADRVVLAIDPRQLPTLAPAVRRTMPVIPPVICHLGLDGEVPDLPPEVVLYGDPMLVLRTRGTAPDGQHAWTVLGRGRLAEDIVSALERHGIRVRDRVRTRVDRSPRDLVEAWHGSPAGVLWQGRRTLDRMLGTVGPVPGLFLAGAHAPPGSGLPYVGLSASLVAQAIGPAR